MIWIALMLLPVCAHPGWAGVMVSVALGMGIILVMGMKREPNDRRDDSFRGRSSWPENVGSKS